MKELRDVIIAWVDKRMDDMLSAPRMWGSDEAIELQMLLLLELRTLALQPADLEKDPRLILDAYSSYIAKTYPKTPNLLLSRIVESDHLGLRIAADLRKFREQMDKQVKGKRPSVKNAITANPKKNPWQEFDLISQGLSVPPRLMNSAVGGPL